MIVGIIYFLIWTTIFIMLHIEILLLIINKISTILVETLYGIKVYNLSNGIYQKKGRERVVESIADGL